jgi:hypothetical protein
MRLIVAEPVLPLGMGAALVVARGVDAARTPPAMVAWRRDAGRRLAAAWKTRSTRADPRLAAWAAMQAALGTPDDAVAPEKILQALRRRGELPPGTAIDDLCTVVSARTLLVVGAHDLARLPDPLVLHAPAEALPGEATRPAREASDLAFVLAGGPAHSPGDLLRAAWLLVEAVETLLGGHAQLAALVPAAHVVATAGGPPASDRPRLAAAVFQRLALAKGTVRTVGRHPSVPGLSVASVNGRESVPAIAAEASLQGLRPGDGVLLASGLHPLRAGDETYTAWLVTAGAGPDEAVVRFDSPIPDGATIT